MTNDDFSGDYARDAGWSGGGSRDDYVRVRGFRGIGPRNYRRADERIAEEVCERLTDDHDVDARGIEVRVENAEVYLTGRVASRFEKRRAEDLALDCRGVHDVQNTLRVTAADEEVRIGKASE